MEGGREEGGREGGREGERGREGIAWYIMISHKPLISLPAQAWHA